jgi:hypothetical protein
MATDGELDRVVHQYLQHRNYKVSEWVSRLSSCTCAHHKLGCCSLTETTASTHSPPCTRRYTGLWPRGSVLRIISLISGMLVAREWLDSLGQCCCSHHTQPTIEMLCGVRVRRQLFLCKITHTHHTHHTYAHALFKCNRAPNHPPIPLTFVPLLLEMRGRLDLLSHDATTESCDKRKHHSCMSLLTAKVCAGSSARFLSELSRSTVRPK